MKKSIFALLPILFLATLAMAQNKETRTLSSFNSIGISGGFDGVYLREGASESVSIEAEGISLDKIITEVQGDELKIGMKKGSYNYKKIKIYVTYRAIKEINNSGSTDVVAETTIKGDEFTFNSSGSGDFKGSLDVKDLDINISGSSDIAVSGRADSQEYAISGSGDVNAADCKGTSAEVAISGSGDVRLNVSGRVKTSVSGSGNVTNNN